MSESPIFAIQESYYRAKSDAILTRTFNELGHPLVEMFGSQAHAELTLKELRKVRAFTGAFDVLVKEESANRSFLIITPVREESRIHYRDLNQVIARISELARNGIATCAEICKSPNKAKKLSEALEELEFYCVIYDDNIVVISW